jgi:hypothetical protein
MPEQQEPLYFQIAALFGIRLPFEPWPEAAKQHRPKWPASGIGAARLAIALVANIQSDLAV